MREAELDIPEAAIEAMGIDDLLAVTRAAGLRSVEEVACHGTGGVLSVEVADRIDEVELDGLDCVKRWEHVAEHEGTHVYVISFRAPELPAALEETTTDLVGTCDPEVGDRGATVSWVGPQETIAAQVREYERAGASPDLRRLGSYDGPEHPLDGLTERQQEVLETAWEAGYYEVPKTATTEDVAAALGVDDSTVTEHLQRAERNLLSRLLGEG